MPFTAEDRALLTQSVERFVADHSSLERRRALLLDNRSFERRSWQALAEMGVLTLPFAEEVGGLDGSLADVMAVTRVLGRGLALEPYIPCIIVAGRLLEALATQAQQSAWLTPLMAGSKLVALAHAERLEQTYGVVGQTKLRRLAGTWRLVGSKLLVPVAGELDAFLVSARDELGSLRLCIVPAETAGVAIRSYRTVDGQLAGEVAFDAVAIQPDAILGIDSEDIEARLASVLTYARAALAADMAGSMSALLRMTIDYCNTRKQFGQPLSHFQVLKHRLVDCHTAVEQAEALLELAAMDQAPRWAANVAAAKAFIDEHALKLGHEAIQMHGGMGLTDELAVSHHHKRQVANSLVLGDRPARLDEVIAGLPLTDATAPSSALPFDQLLTPNEARLRQDVRAFLDAELTPDFRKISRRLTCTFPEREQVIAWQKRLHARGWLAPLWPKEFGGTGWSAVERFLFEYECAVGGAPERSPMGFRYVGPVIARFGSPWQQDYFLPRLMSSEHYWAQGFSEPQAGSDLAALKTSARIEGEHYVVNGTKIWTTNGHVADWIFCLVRTAQANKPQEGISFLLIDLKSPGIRIEPIRLLAVDHEVNQVFFDDVRVPARNLVGEPGRGWSYAKFLLELERGGSVISGRARHELNAVKELVTASKPHLLQDRGFLRSLASIEIRLMALELLEFRLARKMTNAADPGVSGSISKLLSSELQCEITEMGAQVAGLAGLEFEMARPLREPRDMGYAGSDLELVAQPRYLNTRAFRIFAGSSEIQRDIIAQRILGLRS